MATGLLYDYVGAKKAGYTDKEIAEALASEVGYDLAGARKAGWKDAEIISALNTTNASVLDTFATNFASEMGSEIKGLGQLLGVNEPSTMQETLRQQMANENPVAGVLGTIAGGIVNPSTFIPGSLLFKGAKGTAAAGAIAGSVGGALEPIFTPEDSRLENAAWGFGIGGALGTVLGILSKKFGAGAIKAFEKEIKDLVDSGAPIEEIERIIKPHIKLKSSPDQASVVEEVEGITKPRIQLKSTPDQASPYVAVDTQPNEVFDSIQPLLDGIGDPVEKEAIVLSLGKGDYTSFFNSAPFRNSEVPVDRLVAAFGENNPNRIQNMDAFIKNKLQGREQSEQLLTQVYTALKSDVATQLGKFNRVVLPEDIGVERLLDKRVQEVLDADTINAFLPAVKKAKDDLFTINELMNTLQGSGMTREEAAAVLMPDFVRAKNILTAATGNASNLGLALNAVKQQAKIMGSTKKVLAQVMETQGDDLQKLLFLNDSFKSIDGALDYNLDKVAAKQELIKAAVSSPNWKEKAGEYAVNAFISGLATPAVNVMSAGFKMPMAVATRFVQGLIPGSGISVRESGAMLRGIFQGLTEGTAFAKEGFISGMPTGSTTEIKQAIGGKLGEVIRTPSKVGVSADEWAKAVFRRMEWNALATRVGYSGKFTGREEEVINILRSINLGDASTKIMRQEVKAADGKILQKQISIPEWANKILEKGEALGMTKDEAFSLAQQVHYFAKQQTFQEEFVKGSMMHKIMAFRAQHPEMAFIVPFVKTPLNIMKDALSYMGGTLNPRAYRNMSKDERIARLAVGAGMVAMLGSKVADGTITGSYSKDADKRNAAIAAGIPEYSIRIGDTWYSYARIEPIATVLGTTVDGIKTTAEYFAKNPNDRKASEWASDTISGFTKNIASKTFLEGISGMLQAIHDPERYGSAFINGFAGLLVPSFVAAPARALDPNMRVTTDFADVVQNRLPFLREQLPAQSMLYGGERPNLSSGLSAFTGIQTKTALSTPLQEEAARVKFDYDLPSKKLKGVELSNEDIARYQQLSSQRADAILNAIISNPAYQNLTDARKKVILENGMRRARSLATKQMAAEKSQDPEFRLEAFRQRMKKKGLLEEEEE